MNMEWIPVTESLPEKSGAYLVTEPDALWRPVHTAYFNSRTGWSGYDEGGCPYTAWMPLPEQYREDTE